MHVFIDDLYCLWFIKMKVQYINYYLYVRYNEKWLIFKNIPFSSESL